MFAIINTKYWALETDFYARVKPYIIKSLEKGTPLLDMIPDVLKRERKSQFILSAKFEGDSQTGSPRANGSKIYNVAVIPLSGVMQKNSDACQSGTVEVRAMIAQANQDPNISAIVLHTDSPGGSVDGTEDLGNDVKNSSKPVVAFVDGLAASAGYWVASQAKEIVVNTETTAWIGSIGVLCTHLDQSAYLEKEGLKVSIIRADQSTDKAQFNSLEPLSEEIVAGTKKDLNTIADTFIKIVKQGRGDRLKADDVFTGKVFNGKDALKKGMVDSIGSLQDAVNLAAKYADKQQKSNSNPNSNMKIKVTSFPFLAKILGLGGEEAEIKAEDLDKAELAIKVAEDAKTQVQASLTEAQEKIKTFEASITTKDAQIKTLEDWKAAAEPKDKRKSDANSQGEGKVVAAYQTEANVRADKAIALKEQLKGFDTI